MKCERWKSPRTRGTGKVGSPRGGYRREGRCSLKSKCWKSMEGSDCHDDVNEGERVYSKHAHINMQTYKCSTHQSYPYSAFLASERRRERDRALSLCLQIPLPNSPLKGARCPTKKKKSGGNTTSTTRDPSPRLLIQTRSITCTRSTTETKATTSCKRDARRTFAARRISVRICVAEICLPKFTRSNCFLLR